MKNSIKLLLIIGTALFLFASCTNMKSAKMVPDRTVIDLSPQYLAGDIASKVDGWVLLLDSSLSMNKEYEGYVKFDIAKAFVEKLNNTLPPIPAESGLRTFGHAPQVSSKKTELFYGMSEFNRGSMEQGISKVTYPGGPTPMGDAIKAATADLKDIRGKKALIIVSDGEDLDEQPVAAAREMTAQLGNDICIYTVHVGDDKDGKALMEKIAETTPCGFMVSALEIFPADPMAGYVSQVFLSGRASGLGYHKPQKILKSLTGVHFKFDDHSLTKEGKAILDENIKILNENPGLKLTIEGHASAKGSETYNQNLSEQRASNVRNYMISKGKISPDRLSAVGYGETRPKVREIDPETANSPAALSNRRVEFKVTK